MSSIDSNLSDLALAVPHYLTTQFNANRQHNLEYNQFEYNKYLNDLIMEREDNYMQRRLADFTASGFSPLAALENAAGNYSSTVTPVTQHYDSFSNLQNGMNQTFNMLSSGLSDLRKYGMEEKKLDEQKRANLVFEAIEYEKLDQKHSEFVDTLKSQEKMAEDALKNQKDIARIASEAQKSINRYTVQFQDLWHTEAQKNQMKMFNAQLDQAWENAKKSRSQNERKIWIDAISRMLTGIAAAYVGSGGAISFNLGSSNAVQMGFHE